MNDAAIERRLAELAGKRVNYDPGQLDLENPPQGWHVDDRWQALPRRASRRAAPRRQLGDRPATDPRV